jgi:hypothetical protein
MSRLVKAIRHPVKFIRRTAEERAVDAELVRQYFQNTASLPQYRRELHRTGLVKKLYQQRAIFKRIVRGKNVRGDQYGFGTIDVETGIRLYAVIRHLKPKVAVETGVCNGFSTAFLLQALQMNGQGKLYSIDFPEVVGQIYEPGTFWEGKGRSAIPPGQTPGWLIPQMLKEPWDLILGKSQMELPKLLRRLGAIDFFMHDSEHSYDCMWLEYEAAYAALRPGGMLASDDTNWNDAFQTFAANHDRTITRIGGNTAFFLK